MFLFGKKKEEPTPAAKPAAPAAPSAPAKPVSAEDFFGDIDKKAQSDEYRPKTKPEEVKPDLEAPVVEGLREAPLPAPESTITDVSTSTIDTDILPDKTLIPPPVPFEIEEPEAPKKAVSDGDDFFADLDRKAARLKEANKLVIEPPSTESLRETAPPPPVSTITDVAADSAETEALPVKPPVESYQGDMNDADVDEEGAEALEFKHFKEEREEDGSLDYSNESYEGIDLKTTVVNVEKIEE